MSEREFLKQLGIKIRLARKKAGLSQVALSKLIPMKAGALCEIEYGLVSCRITTLRSIAQAIKIDVKEFL